jgi:hypothetical protein
VPRAARKGQVDAIQIPKLKFFIFFFFFLPAAKGGKKKVHIQLTPEELDGVLNVTSLQQEMQGVVDDLKQNMIHQLLLRSSSGKTPTTFYCQCIKLKIKTKHDPPAVAA